MSEDFRAEIAKLAESARQEILEKQESGEAPPARRKVSPVIWIGAVLVFAEAILFGTQYALLHRVVSQDTIARPHPLVSANTCKGEKYRTFRALLAYRHDHGSWPTSLGELLDQRYLVQTPVAPESGSPLAYSRSGEGFTLECPGVTAPKRAR